MPLLIAALTIALAAYWVVWLPRLLPNFSLGHAFFYVALAAAGAWAIAVWRRTGVAPAAAAGFAFLGGLTGFFWPAIEFLFQGVDGGGMPFREDVMYVTVILAYLAAILAGVFVARNAGRARVMLIAAIGAILFVGLLLPASPPSAQTSVLIGLPFVLGAAVLATVLASTGRARG